jgi:hypothetical protein
MPHLQTKTLLRALCGSFLLLAACDEQDGGAPVEFREWSKLICVTGNSGTTTIKGSGTGYGPVGPWDPDWWMDIDELPKDYVAALEDDFRQRTESFLVADFERDGGTESCERVCAEARLTFDDGGGCVADNDFGVSGLEYAEPGYNDTPRFTMQYEAHVEMGCACNE